MEILQLKFLQNILKDMSTKSKKEEEAEEEDDRDINQLLEFIEGDDKKVQDKKKKKKQKSKEGAGWEGEVEVQEAKVKEKSTPAKKEEASNICFRCHSPATSTKLSKCRGCQKVRRHLLLFLTPPTAGSLL